MGMMPKVIAVLVLAAAGAWYMGLVPEDKLKEAQDALESTVDKVKQEVDKRIPDTEGPKPRPERKPKARPKETPAKETPQAPAKTTEQPAKPVDDVKVPLPKVVVRSKSGVQLANSYFVKGSVENKGGADAANVKVTVTFKGASGDTIAEVEARCPKTVAAGARAKYEAAVTDAQAEQTEEFEVRVEFSGDED
jgi:hypothetical protein